jgi:outer membrane protein
LNIKILKINILILLNTMKSKITIIVFTIFISGNGFSQMPAPLKSLVEQSFQNFPKLKEAEQQIKAGEIRASIAKTALQPFVNGNANYTYITPVAKASFPTPDGLRELQFTPHNNFNFNVSAGVPIYDFGKTRLNIQNAEGGVIIARHALELSRHNLAYQVAQLYYGIAFLNQSIKVQNDIIKNTESVISQLSNRVKNGDALEFDVLNQKVRLENGHNRRDDFETQIEKQKILLSYLTGQPASQIQVTEVGFDLAPTNNAEALITQADAQSKELAMAQDRIMAAKTDIDLAKIGHLPTIAFTGNAGLRNGYVPDINQLRFNIAAGVGLTIPIYAAKRFDLQRQAAQVNLDANKYALESTRAMLRKDIETTLADGRGIEKKLKNLDAQFTQADRAMAIAKNRLDNGVITAVELESAQTAIEEVQLAKISYQYQLFMNQLELKRLVGDVLVK